MLYYFVLNHPAHYHLFKNSILGLQGLGHECEIFIRPKDVLQRLLDKDSIKYTILTDSRRVEQRILLNSIWSLLKKDIELAKHIRKRKPDLMIGTDWSITNVGRIFNIPSLVFNEDDTAATPENKVFYPLAKNLVLPDCCDKKLWENKRVSYAGYHELAYLHCKRFSFNEEVIKRSKIGSRPYIIIRLVKLTASHDKGKRGLGFTLLDKIIERYNSLYEILISFEGEVPEKYRSFSYLFDPDVMHQYLSGAHLFIGDSQTMIAEASILGTPSVRLNDFVGKLSYLEELEHKYKLTYGFNPQQEESFLLKIDELLGLKDLKIQWRDKLNNLYRDKIDVSSFFTWLISSYPDSLEIIKKEPNYQYNFM